MPGESHQQLFSIILEPGWWLPGISNQQFFHWLAFIQKYAQILFPLRCLQTDHGSEFGQALSHLLRQLAIRHTRIRPRTPHLNGKVERVQRTVQEEYWDGVGPGSLVAWERGLQAYVRFYNTQRLHGALAYATPLRYAQQRPPRAQISHMS